MARPKCCRKIGCAPDVSYYKPKGVPARSLEEIVLSLDEYEAIRLADYEGLYQEQAAARMKISRQTFGRIIALAHNKIADVLINGKALKIEGGPVEMNGIVRCKKCEYAIADSGGSDDGKPFECPRCKNIRNMNSHYREE